MDARAAALTAAPYILTTLALSVNWLAGRPRTRGAGWLVGIFILEPLWAVYGVLEQNLGWVLSTIPFTAVFIRNLLQHRRETRVVQLVE